MVGPMNDKRLWGGKVNQVKRALDQRQSSFLGGQNRSGGSVIGFDEVSVSFNQPDGGSLSVIEGLSFTVSAGEFVVIVGKSGCGKTTTLNLMVGLVHPSAGGVRIFGKDPAEVKDKVGYMFARDALLPWRTARKNVEVGLEIRGVDRKARAAAARSALQSVGLAKFGDHYAWQLSQGMRQRVALARTWALSPELLLMDEPFGAVDAQTRRELQKDFIQFWESHQHRTVVFVTHDLVEAIMLGDRIIVMRDGRIVSQVEVPFGRPRDISTLSRDVRLRDLEHQLSELLGGS